MALTSIFVICLANGSFLACFPFGMLGGHLRWQGWFTKPREHRLTEVLVFPFLVLVMAIEARCNHVYPGWDVAPILAACLLVLALYSNASAIRVLRGRVSYLLGQMSFPLYLM